MCIIIIHQTCFYCISYIRSYYQTKLITTISHNIISPFLTKHNIKILYGYGSKAWYLVNPKIDGKWMFIPFQLIIMRFWPTPIWSSRNSSKMARISLLSVDSFGPLRRNLRNLRLQGDPPKEFVDSYLSFIGSDMLKQHVCG
jgi:hypothetical protein